MKMNQENTQTLEIPSDAVVELDLHQVPDTDIVFECPHCGKSHAIDQRGAGLVIPCTDCRQPITVPAVGDTEKQTAAEKTRHKIKIVKKTRPRVAVPNPETILPIKPRGIKELQPIATLLPEGFQEKQSDVPKPRLHVMAKVWGCFVCLIAVAVVIVLLSRDSFELSRCFNGTEVAYTSAVSKREVKRLGAYLVKSGFANGDEKSVEINKAGETYEFRVIPKGDKPLTQSNEGAVDLARGISGVFNGARVEVHLCDTYVRPKYVERFQGFGE